MAVKGLGYAKTTWSFEERPVASSKLNTWDDRIEGALELLFLLQNQALGGASGVLRTGSLADLKVSALAAPGLSVEVGPGYAFINGYPYKLASTTETVDVSAPLVQDRVDLVQASLAAWTVTVKTGTESAGPSAPPPDSDCIALGQIYLRPGMGSIKNADDGTNGHIADVRAFV